MAELEKPPSVVERTYRTTDGVRFLFCREDHPELSGKVLYSIDDKPFRIIEADALRRLIGKERWAIINRLQA